MNRVGSGAPRYLPYGRLQRLRERVSMEGRYRFLAAASKGPSPVSLAPADQHHRGDLHVVAGVDDWGEVGWLVALPRYSAGVYCAHMLIVELLEGANATVSDPFWEIARPFAALALAFALVMSLARVRLLRPVLT